MSDESVVYFREVSFNNVDCRAVRCRFLPFIFPLSGAQLKQTPLVPDIKTLEVEIILNSYFCG